MIVRFFIDRQLTLHSNGSGNGNDNNGGNQNTRYVFALHQLRLHNATLHQYTI